MLTSISLPDVDPIPDPILIPVPIDLEHDHLFWIVTFHYWEKNVNLDFSIWNQILN